MKCYKFDLKNKNCTLEAFIPENFRHGKYEKRPAMLVIPGGGYYCCSDREGEPVALAYTGKGYCSFVLKYSVGKGAACFPNPLNDANEAMEIIRFHCKEWDIDENKIAAIGFSAGGHLCAALGIMGKIKPNAILLGYPCIDEERCVDLCEPQPALDDKVNSDSAPAFIFSSAEDDNVPIKNSLKLALAYDKSHVPFEMHIFSKGYHGFSLANELVYEKTQHIDYSAHLQPWFELSVTWLKKIFYDEEI